MPVEENIQLLTGWFQEVWNERRLQTVHDLMADGKRLSNLVPPFR